MKHSAARVAGEGSMFCCDLVLIQMSSVPNPGWLMLVVLNI